MWNRFRFALITLPILNFFALAQTPPATQSTPAPPSGIQAPQGRGTLSSATNEGADFAPKAPVKPRTPEEQARSFNLPPGYRMELVIAEPDVISPAAIRFDGNGRM